jgi:hypothetical protein
VLEVPTFDFPGITKERKKYAELVDALAAARRRVRDLEAGREAAKKVDQDRYAAAILKSGAGAKNPGRQASEQLEQELEQALHLRASIVSAVEQAEAALVAAVEKERAGILRDLDKRRDKAEREYGERAEALLIARRERDELERLRTQVSRFPLPTKNSTIERPFPIVRPNGVPTSHAEFATALRKDASPAEPTPIAQSSAQSLKGGDRLAAA